ncbi:MAG TPA: MFS transporter [Acidimicrobiales bacterium]|jgi:MFS family permease|nr:MFS transporter [Acidimicrobiales bacterium]
MEGSPVEQSDALLDPVADPGGAAMGTLGDGSVETNWFVLLRRRVSDRAVRSPRYQWWALIALLAGLLATSITFTVFVVALPTVKSEFHTNFSVLAWASTGPLLAFGVAAPFFGKAGDLFGRRRLYQFGLIGAMVSAILTATAPDVGMLLFARVLDGVQGAATGTASMAIILELFAPADRVKALGWWSLVGAGGPVLGVTLGSPVIQYFGWRTLFWGQLVLLVVASVVVAFLLPTSREHREPAVVAAGEEEEAGEAGKGRRRRTRVWEGMDWVGSWSLAGGVTSAMLVLSIGPVAGWTSVGVIVAGVVAVVLAVVFVWRERTFATPLIPTTYWRRRNFMFPMGTKFCTSFAYFGGFFLFPLLMEQVYGYSVSQVGFVSVARPLVFAISAPIAGYLTVRTGERNSTLFGTGALLLSMVIFATLGATSALVVIVVALALSGLGMGVSMPATSSSMSNELAEAEYGVMSAAQLLSAQVGEVAGIQIVLTIQESLAKSSGLGNVHHSTALLHSFRVPFWVGAAVAAAAVAFALFIRPLRRDAHSAHLAADAA